MSVNQPFSDSKSIGWFGDKSSQIGDDSNNNSNSNGNGNDDDADEANHRCPFYLVVRVRHKSCPAILSALSKGSSTLSRPHGHSPTPSPLEL